MSHESEKELEHTTPIEFTCSVEALKDILYMHEGTGIGVTVLAKAGETYTEYVSDPNAPAGKNGKMSLYTVPEGGVRAEIADGSKLMNF
jgi:hypothetical protein